MLVGEYIGHQEGQNRKDKRYGDIACKVRAAGEYYYKPKQIHCKDEKEDCHQVRRKTLCLRAESRLHNSVVHKSYYRLDCPKTFTGSAQGMVAVETCQPYHQSSHKKNGDEKRTHVFCNREIPGAHFASVDNLHDFAFIGAVVSGNAEFDTVVDI